MGKTDQKTANNFKVVDVNHLLVVSAKAVSGC
jgi:hypothetical protein